MGSRRGASLLRSLSPLFVTAATVAALATPARAATFTVTKTADTADGACDADCSLREAVIAANTTPGPDTIVVPTGTFALTISGPSEGESSLGVGSAVAAAGDLDITDHVSVTGSGPTLTIIEAGADLGFGEDRAVHVHAGVTATISGVTIQHGRGLDGGGLRFEGGAASLTLNHVIVRENLARSNGGGISAQGGVLHVVDSLIEENRARLRGGGIALAGGTQATVTRSSVSRNVAGSFDSSSTGGGLWAQEATLQIVDSTVDGNRAVAEFGGGGGGIALEGGSQTTITRSTVSANTVGRGEPGGGISAGFEVLSLTIDNSTISGNFIENPINPFFAGGRGGGIHHLGGALTITNATIAFNGAAEGSFLYTTTAFGGAATIKNTIVGPRGGGFLSCAGATAAIVSLGHNLDEADTCNFHSVGDQVNTDAMLGALRNNGGPTETHALGTGSPAIDAGDNARCPAIDQRGVSRPQGPACDAGAFEFAISPVGIIRGTVVEQDSDLRLAAARVAACLVGGTCVAPVMTDLFGNYLIIDLSPGEYALQAEPPAGRTDLAPRTIGPFALAAGQVLVEQIGLLSATGTIRGSVGASAFGFSRLANVEVHICPAAGAVPCAVRRTDADGAFEASGLSRLEQWVVKAFPPNPPPAGFPPDLPPISIAVDIGGGDRFVSLQFGALRPPPPGTTTSARQTNGEGIPIAWSSEPIIVTTIGSASGSARYASQTGGTTLNAGSMTETPSGSGTYVATVPAPGRAGIVLVTVTIECPDGTLSVIAFNIIYIDPSGVVRDAITGEAVEGATVTLFRASMPAGPFAVVPDGDRIMSPANRRNPDSTDADGRFGWDVMAGFYTVRAEKAGCISPSDPAAAYVESAVLTIPPPVTDLDLQLSCAGDDGDRDGVADLNDNCPAIPNADQVDTDADGEGDACDADDDNDGAADEDDAFPLDPNESVDTDGDGAGNNADADDDGDGQSDADESACGSDPLDPASRSSDTDGDGALDCLDPDDDNDGVPDGADNCPATANPDQRDLDRDGIGDACDALIGPPLDKEDCKQGGWMVFNNPEFRNQGECVSSVVSRRSQ